MHEDRGENNPGGVLRLRRGSLTNLEGKRLWTSLSDLVRFNFFLEDFCFL